MGSGCGSQEAQQRGSQAHVGGCWWVKNGSKGENMNKEGWRRRSLGNTAVNSPREAAAREVLAHWREPILA